MSVSESFLRKNMHPRIVVASYMKALESSLEFLEKQCIHLDLTNREQMMSIVRSSLGEHCVNTRAALHH